MQTLKPCPFCGNAPTLNHMGSGSYTVSCSSGHHINTEASKENAITAWNERPAAPVEGLVRYDEDFDGGEGIQPFLDGDYVRFDQADAIIAAERAEKESWKDLFGNSSNTNSDLHDKVATLQADNAALTARVKELETERDEALDDAKFAERIATKREIDANANVEAIETQLAAAKKALEEIAHPKALTSLSRDKARAALEDRP